MYLYIFVGRVMMFLAKTLIHLILYSRYRVEPPMHQSGTPIKSIMKLDLRPLSKTYQLPLCKSYVYIYI